MATLHLIGGEKGGVGKSLVACTVAQYHLDRGTDFALFDADRSTPDVKRIYGKVGCQDAVFSENKKERDKAIPVYYAAMEKTTIVNLPPQVMIPLFSWFKDNKVFEMAKRDGVVVNHWFVSNGEYESLKLFGEYLDYFKNDVKHSLVKNWGLCDQWYRLENDETLKSKMEEYDVKIIDFPKYEGEHLLSKISENGLTLGEVRDGLDSSFNNN